MRSFTYQVSGDESPPITTVVRGIRVNDLTDPLAIVKKLWNWGTDGGYSVDGEELNGLPATEGGQPRPSLKFYEYAEGNIGQPAEIFLNGNATKADGIPFRFSAAQPVAALFSRGIPRVPGVAFEVAIKFERPGGYAPIVLKFRENIE